MPRRLLKNFSYALSGLVAAGLLWFPSPLGAADKLIGFQSARVMAQSLLFVAQDTGLYQKHNLDFQLVYVSSSTLATAALLGGDVEVGHPGGPGVVRAFVQGVTDLVFIGCVKNVMTQSIVSKAEIKRPEDLRGKRVGVTRIGSNTHYFTIQAMRRYGLEPGRDFTFIQTGGEHETLAALVGGGLDAATMTAPADARAIASGFRYLIYGPDLRIPFPATPIATRRSSIAKRPQVIGQFMRAMAEASKILHTDRELSYKILGKHLRVTDRSVLDEAYNAEIKALEPRLAIKNEALQAILDEVSATDPRAKKVKPQEMVDSRYLDEMEKSGFFDQVWGTKR